MAKKRQNSWVCSFPMSSSERKRSTKVVPFSSLLHWFHASATRRRSIFFPLPLSELQPPSPRSPEEGGAAHHRSVSVPLMSGRVDGHGHGHGPFRSVLSIFVVVGRSLDPVRNRPDGGRGFLPSEFVVPSSVDLCLSLVGCSWWILCLNLSVSSGFSLLIVGTRPISFSWVCHLCVRCGCGWVRAGYTDTSAHKGDILCDVADFKLGRPAISDTN